MDASQLRTIEQQVGEGLDEKKLAGAVTMVIRNGGVVHLEAQGWQDIENRVPMRTDTIFRIYSMTKPIVSTAVMMLAESGKIDLDAHPRQCCRSNLHPDRLPREVAPPS